MENLSDNTQLAIWLIAVVVIMLGVVYLITIWVQNYLNKRAVEENEYKKKLKKRGNNTLAIVILLITTVLPISSFAQSVSQEEVDKFVGEGYFIRSYPVGEDILDNEPLMKELQDLEIGFNVAVDLDSIGVLQDMVTQAKEMYLDGVFRGGYVFMTTKEGIGVLEYDMRDEDINDFFTMIFNRSESENLYLKDNDANFCIIRPGGIFPYIGNIEKLSLLHNTEFTNFVTWLEERPKIE